MYSNFAAQLRDETGTDIALRTEGTLCLARNEEEAQALQARSAWQQAAGLRASWLPPEEVRELEPALSPHLRGALYLPQDYQVDNRKLALALAAAAMRAGVRLRVGLAATRVRANGERVLGVEARTETLVAGTVINAAGSWARLIGGVPSRLCPPIRPLHGQMVSLSMPPEPLVQHVLRTSQIGLVPRQDGRLLVGPTCEERGYDKAVTAGGVHQLLHGALEAAPGLADLPLYSTWSGLQPSTPDGWPVLGRTDLEGWILACGHGPHGILLTPATAELIADLVETGVTPRLLAPFTLARFETSVP